MTERIVLFDGECGLCTGSVQFIIQRDRSAAFRFAPLQSEVGHALCAEHGIDAEQMSSVVLVQDGVAFTRSSAAVRIARRLDGPFRAAAAAWIIPRPLRDWLYGVIARNRRRWFETQESCWVPGPEIRARFLDIGATPG